MSQNIMEIFCTQTTIEIVLHRNVCTIRLEVQVTDKKELFLWAYPKCSAIRFLKCVVHVVQPWRPCRHPWLHRVVVVEQIDIGYIGDLTPSPHFSQISLTMHFCWSLLLKSERTCKYNNMDTDFWVNVYSPRILFLFFLSLLLITTTHPPQQQQHTFLYGLFIFQIIFSHYIQYWCVVTECVHRGVIVPVLRDQSKGRLPGRHHSRAQHVASASLLRRLYVASSRQRWRGCHGESGTCRPVAAVGRSSGGVFRRFTSCSCCNLHKILRWLRAAWHPHLHLHRCPD